MTIGLTAACGNLPPRTEGVIEILYSLAREYTGDRTNSLSIEVTDQGSESYTMSFSNPDAAADVEQDVFLPLESRTVTFTYGNEGIYSTALRIQKENGHPYIYELLTWEFSTEIPDPPIISFAEEATATTANILLLADSLKSNTTEIWIGGDVSPDGRGNLEAGGYWQQIPPNTPSLTLNLSPGNGLKVVEAKVRNIYGNESELGDPAQIYLKQTPPSACDAVPLRPTVSNNKVSLKMYGLDTGPVYYSVMGDVKQVIAQKEFDNEDIVFVYVEPTSGQKSIVVYIEDVAGNICLEKRIDITLDPDFESEGIWIDGHEYWTDDEEVKLDVYFDHFPDQEPLELRISGDVSGPNTHQWIDYVEGIEVTLTPPAGGDLRIFAQYRDSEGTESYYVSKRVFLKPKVTVTNGAGMRRNILPSNIFGAQSLTITGCDEDYNDVAYSASYDCLPVAASISVTWKFPGGATVTKSATP